MLNRIYGVCGNRLYWIAGASYLLLMEAIALFWQYALEYYPCALCVQIRAWVYGAMFSAIFGAFVSDKFWLRWSALTLTLFFMGGALYTSWYSYGVEMGTVISSCSMGAGFPEFMMLDEWIPVLFRADGFCGQSPEMWFGLSMNQTLLVTLGVPTLVLAAQWVLHLTRMAATSAD